ncbi:chemotaxis protein CheW [Ammoniphilus sp. CFH 90114]|uniref:chemotaxis protein CheW n=1 Tax=Ammoniphilus sp. CFH 90114 TaxID=2493665 RepID=UPI00100E417F|nr:chemotaxis protein CheW [Ammoniphilus sp. CFH 90114]RXT15135.1 chemotaxis protein CheW [Ammoniphilus sp. CFH 90114]
MQSSLGEVAEEMKVIVFRLQDEEYGVEVEQVKSIERLEKITRVPRTPSFVKGVINLRGVVTPIIDLRERFGLGDSQHTDSTRIIIVTIGGLEVGLIVDSATDVIDVAIDAVEPPPCIVGGVEAVYLKGVAKLEKRLLILLNLNKVLDASEMQQLERIEGTVG